MKRRFETQEKGNWVQQSSSRPRYETQETKIVLPLEEPWEFALHNALSGKPFYQSDIKDEKLRDNLQQKCRRRTDDWKTCASIWKNQVLAEPFLLVDSCGLECVLNNLPTYVEYKVYGKLGVAVEDDDDEDVSEDESGEKYFPVEESISSWYFNIEPDDSQSIWITFNFHKDSGTFTATIHFGEETRNISVDVAKDLISYYSNRANIHIAPEISYTSDSDDVRDFIYSSVVPTSQGIFPDYRHLTIRQRKDDEPIRFE